MKILAFTDLHLSKEHFKKLKRKVFFNRPNIIVCAGDISIFEQGLKEVLDKLSKLKEKIIMIHGNHEEDTVMKKLCEKHENIIFIHKKHYEEQGVIFLGYGGGGFSSIEKGFSKTGKNFSKIIKKNPEKKIVFITHAPPYNTKLDIIIDESCGNKTFRQFIEKNRVDIAISGHLHENFGKEDKINDTLILNPGPSGKIIKL